MKAGSTRIISSMTKEISVPFWKAFTKNFSRKKKERKKERKPNDEKLSYRKLLKIKSVKERQYCYYPVVFCIFLMLWFSKMCSEFFYIFFVKMLWKFSLTRVQVWNYSHSHSQNANFSSWRLRVFSLTFKTLEIDFLLTCNCNLSLWKMK